MDEYTQEEIFLLQSIVQCEGWVSAPSEEEFFTTLTSIEMNTDDEFVDIIQDFIKSSHSLPYTQIQEQIESLTHDPV